MEETRHLTVMRRKIALRNGVILIFDYEAGRYRAALYRPRRPGEKGYAVERDLYDSMVRAGMLPKKPREYWVRVAYSSNDLKHSIECAFIRADCASSLDSVLEYIRGTEWGEQLCV